VLRRHGSDTENGKLSQPISSWTTRLWRCAATAMWSSSRNTRVPVAALPPESTPDACLRSASTGPVWHYVLPWSTQSLYTYVSTFSAKSTSDLRSFRPSAASVRAKNATKLTLSDS